MERRDLHEMCRQLISRWQPSAQGILMSYRVPSLSEFPRCALGVPDEALAVEGVVGTLPAGAEGAPASVGAGPARLNLAREFESSSCWASVSFAVAGPLFRSQAVTWHGTSAS